MKKLLTLLLAFCVILSSTVSVSAFGFLDWLLEEEYPEADTTWAIYWYLCGSDLESEYGCASTDLDEMMTYNISPNVTVVIQTGGASTWENDDVSADRIGRYVYRDHSLEQVDSLPQANMGDSATLESFLSFCKKNYPADKEMVIFWDHGGGSCAGVCYDENYNYDYLTITELKQAMTNVFGVNAQNPGLEFVGFDTCLMSTIDTAAAMHGVARYMIASEETEPGCGWYYGEFLRALSQNPDMDSTEFGIAVCDAYMEGCEIDDSADNATLSVLDLGKFPALLNAYEAMGKEALESAGDKSFFSELGRGARKTENYGGNTRSAGYTDMADLGDMLLNNMNLFPETAEAVLEAIEDCVVYRRSGDYRAKAQGISFFYPYSGDIDMLSAYADSAAGAAITSFYQKMLTGSSSFSFSNGSSSGSGFGGNFSSTPSETPSSSGSNFSSNFGGNFGHTSGSSFLSNFYGHSEPVVEVPDEMTITLDDDLCANMTIPMDVMDDLAGIYIQLVMYDDNTETMIYLGRDTNLEADWDTGDVMAEFTGSWGALNGHICYMEPVFESMDYNIYNVPIYLNGEACQLVVVYDYDKAAYKICGAREGLEEGLMSGRVLIRLEPGDTITTIVYASDYDDDSEYYYGTEYETFTLEGEAVFEDDFLPDAYYYMPFELVDYRSNSTIIDSPFYLLEDGMISALEDE